MQKKYTVDSLKSQVAMGPLSTKSWSVLGQHCQKYLKKSPALHFMWVLSVCCIRTGAVLCTWCKSFCTLWEIFERNAFTRYCASVNNTYTQSRTAVSHCSSAWCKGCVCFGEITSPSLLVMNECYQLCSLRSTCTSIFYWPFPYCERSLTLYFIWVLWNPVWAVLWYILLARHLMED